MENIRKLESLNKNLENREISMNDYCNEIDEISFPMDLEENNLILFTEIIVETIINISFVDNWTLQISFCRFLDKESKLFWKVLEKLEIRGLLPFNLERFHDIYCINYYDYNKKDYQSLISDIFEYIPKKIKEKMVYMNRTYDKQKEKYTYSFTSDI